MVKAVFLIYALLFSSIGFCSECLFSKSASEADGAWIRKEFLGRDVIAADKNGMSFRVCFDIPFNGEYQLYAYVHQNWRKYTPFIMVEAQDSDGRRYSSETFFEPCWYLDEDASGRWIMHSLSAGSFWTLSRGKTVFEFSIRGRKSMWSSEEVPMEAEVAIERFFLVPVFSGESYFSNAILDPEFLSAPESSEPYEARYGCGTIVCPVSGFAPVAGFSVPSDGRYAIFLSLCARDNVSVEISLEPGEERFELKLRRDEKGVVWSGEVVGPVYLKKGKYLLKAKSVLGKRGLDDEVKIDYIWVIPCANSLRI